MVRLTPRGSEGRVRGPCGGQGEYGRQGHGYDAFHILDKPPCRPCDDGRPTHKFAEETARNYNIIIGPERHVNVKCKCSKDNASTQVEIGLKISLHYLYMYLSYFGNEVLWTLFAVSAAVDAHG